MTHLISMRTFALAASIAIGAIAAPCQAVRLGVTNLVSDDPVGHPAQITDPGLKNAWGISASPTGPFWVSSNGAGTAVLYRVDSVTQATTKVGLTVSIPGDGSVTGQVFNSSGAAAFNGDPFLFVNEDGTISGWRGALGTTAEVLQLASDAVYKGSAFALTGGHSYLYAANFHSGKVDVLKGDAGAPDLAGSFTDPALPSGYAPFNIQNLGGKLYVAYAKQGAGKDEEAGAGKGFVSVFDLQGNFLGRVGSGGTLDAPWGMAIAPSSFGAFAGDLLVGNFGDGRINVFDQSTNSFLGQLLDASASPLAIDGLWALAVGRAGASGGSVDDVYFTAGPGEEAHGLFGVLTVASAAAPEPGSAALTLLGLTGLAALRRRR